MAKKNRKIVLSELQLSVMRVIWNRSEATIAEVVEDLQRERGLAHTTVATLLLRLEKRGLLSKRKDGRAYLYTALVSGADAKRSMVSAFVASLFQGDSKELLTHLIRSEDVTLSDIAKIKAKLQASDRD